MEQSFVFIYTKDGKIKCLSLDGTRKNQDELLEDGWKHIQTLDACAFIEYLYNNCDDTEKIIELKQLVKIS